MSDSLFPHGLQHTRPPCPSPSPWVHPSSCPLNQGCRQPSHPRPRSSPFAFSLSQHQGLTIIYNGLPRGTPPVCLTVNALTSQRGSRIAGNYWEPGERHGTMSSSEFPGGTDPANTLILCFWEISVILSPLCEGSITQSCQTLWPCGLQPTRLLCPWHFPGKNTGVGCHFLLQGIFPSQGPSPHLLRWQVDSLWLSHLGSLYAMQLVISGDNCPRNWRTPFRSNFISVCSPLAHSASATVASLLLLRQPELTPILSLCTCYFLSWKLSSPRSMSDLPSHLLRCFAQRWLLSPGLPWSSYSKLHTFLLSLPTPCPSPCSTSLSSRYHSLADILPLYLHFGRLLPLVCGLRGRRSLLLLSHPYPQHR